MSRCDRINKRLNARFGGRVRADERDGCLVLSGALDSWDCIVEAGTMCARHGKYLGLVNDIRLNGVEIPPMRVPPVRDDALDGLCADVLVVGGGIIGCAIARELTRWKLKVLLCEKEHDVALHASSRNDGMVHPGIDLIPGQVKRRYNMRGNRMYDRVTAELGVPFSRTGQYLCMQSLPAGIAAFFAQLYYLVTGVPVRFCTRRSLARREPELSERIRSALFFPTAGIVCPYSLTIAYAENAADNGARVCLDTAALGMEVQDARIRSVRTNRGTVYPRVVINAAGVFSEDVAEMAQDRFFSIHPRKGTNSILDSKAAHQVRTIAASFGTSSTHRRHTKGGGLVSTVDGNLLVGPDAHETYEKENFSTAADSIRDTFEKQRRTSPQLSERDIITYFTGVRAATYEEDFVITRGKRIKNIVHAAGIQSPGLTAAPAIAQDVAGMAVSLLREQQEVVTNPAFNPVRRGIVHAADLPAQARAALIAGDPDYGEIICRCEQVSRGEILAALRRSVPCDTLDGVKRRVRPGMGRCQGGFCGPQVLQIIAQEKGIPPESVKKSGCGSEVLLASNKEVRGNGAV